MGGESGYLSKNGDIFGDEKGVKRACRKKLDIWHFGHFCQLKRP